MAALLLGSKLVLEVHAGRATTFRDCRLTEINLAAATSLLQAAEDAGARFHFDCALESVDFERRELHFASSDGLRCEARFDSVIGADGAGSALRAAMMKVADLGERIEWLGHSYKELEIPAAPKGGFLIEPNALHIWPRGGYMLIALPNIDGSFTVTLFLANEGRPSFAGLNSADAARDFFASINGTSTVARC